MPAIDLSTMSIPDLTLLIDDATKQRDKLIADRRAELQREMDELNAIGSSKPVNARSAALKEMRNIVRAPAKPKYQSKKDPSLTWPGKGSDPSWLKEEMQATGLPKDAFLIK